MVASLAEKFEARMLPYLFHGHRTDLFRHQSRQPFVQRHAQRADAFAAQAQGGRQHQVGAIRFQQVGKQTSV